MKAFCLYVLLFLPGVLFGQAYHFNKLGIEQGLSQISVLSIHQDHLNRIWIGTVDGLNCYNGVDMKIYRQKKSDPNSLLGHNVKEIIQQGNSLWILTNDGISELNLINQHFVRYPVKDAISLASYGPTILVGTKQGLHYIDTENRLIKPSRILQGQRVEITQLYAPNNNLLYIGTSANGLYRYSAKTKKTVHRTFNALPHISSIKESDNKLWVSSAINGVALLDHDLNLISHFTRQPENPNSLIDDRVRVVHIDTEKKVWIGTFQGLSVYDQAHKTFTNLNHNDLAPGSLSHNSIWDLMEDAQHTMWVGTYFGGVNYTNTESNIYNYYDSYNNNKGHISYRVVGKMLEDGNKNLWIATEGGGLDFYDRQKEVIINYRKTNTGNGISENNVRALYIANKEQVYVGTHLGGLNRINTRTQQVEQFRDLPLNKNTIVSSISPYQNKLLLGTDIGILVFDPQAETLSHFIIDQKIRNKISSNVPYVQEDSFGNIWIGTNTLGLFRYNPKTKELKHYHEQNSELGNNRVNLITEDHQLRMWVGTLGGGVNLYDRRNDTFTNFNKEQDGLPSNFIYGIQESRFGNFWISTSQGLSRFDLENNKFYHHSINSGFPLLELNQSSLLLTSNGELFVGGINGLISFEEEKLFSTGKPFNVILSSIYVNNQELSPQDENSLLKSALPFTKEIILEPAHQVISIQYAACNYLSAFRNTYQYKLEGFDDNWVDAGFKTSVNYTNLSPGTYTFKVRGLDAIYKKVIDGASLRIIVEPPVYLTWYAYVVYVLLLVSLIAFFNSLYLSKIRLRNQLKLEKQEKKQIRKINKRKLSFFTNVSHEFMTPLSIITGTIETLMETAKIPASVYPKLVLAHKNASRLKKLSSELLDFRKLELGHLKIKVSEQDFVPFIKEIFESFTGMAAHREINYRFTTNAEQCTLWFDPNQMDKVFYNLLSNSFKFVDNKAGKIDVEVIAYQDHLEVLIRDNGKGIPKDKADKIFDRFYQIENLYEKSAGQGTGIGLALSKGIVEHHAGTIGLLSEENTGTTFRVTLRKGSKHFAPEQILEEPSPYHAPARDYVYPAYTEEIPSRQVTNTSILLVEDNDDAREYLHNILQENYEVYEASNGQEGLTKALELQPDLIISDVLMPAMTGTQMCAVLKRNIQTCHIPIILLTGQSTTASRVEGLETGADDYIAKPFDPRILLARIANIVKNRELLQQSFNTTPNTRLSDIAHTRIDQDFMQSAQQFVLSNITDSELDVTTFAREMGLSRTKLYEKLKGVTGQTPNEFIQTTRLKKAAELLLQDEELNVSQIAYEVGFSSSRYFSQCFKLHFGISPSKYGKVKLS